MKMKNLKIMRKAGIKVPDFFVISWEDSVKNQIKDENLENDSEKLRQKLRENIVIGNLPLKDAMRYAVRSSCNVEDSKTNSFAGMFDTFLNVDAKEVEKYAVSCMLSLYNDKVLEYCKSRDIDIRSMYMDVIVQEMVDAELSGVIFTSNPQGILNEMTITVGEGLGEGIVSDKVDTVTYYYNVSDKKYYLNGEKDLLSLEMLEQIVSTAEKIKDTLNLDYADIEFSIIGEELFILQARRITSIDDEEAVIYDNSNIVESYPNISLPLSISFAKAVYSGVFTGLAKRIIRNERILDKNKDSFENMVGDINGAMYYKIDNWYKMLQILPFSKKLIGIWQEMLGVKNKNYSYERLDMPSFYKLKSVINFCMEFYAVRKNMDKLNEEYKRVNSYFKENFSKELDNKQLKELYDTISQNLLKVWDITLINDMYAFLFTHFAKKRGNNQKIAGIKDIHSMKPAREMIKLAMSYAKQGDSQAYKEQKSAYIEKYGDRVLEELKLETRTFRTNPELLDLQIEKYVEDEQKLLDMYQNTAEEKEKDEREDFFTKRALIGIKNREISRLNRTGIYGMVRSIFDAIAENFEKQGLIEKASDIYYLSMEEIFDNIEKMENKKEIIYKRKELYQSYRTLPTYNRIIATKNGIKSLKGMAKLRQKSIAQERYLTGVPCSSGRVRAEAVVIENMNDVVDVKDKIIIAKMTDPGWVFLLISAKGIITEKGSLLSHTAIISRELKLASIVAVNNVTNLIKTGDIVEMDASSGEIWIEKKS